MTVHDGIIENGIIDIGVIENGVQHKNGKEGVGQYVVSVGEAFYDMIADQVDTPISQVKSWTPKLGGAPTNFCVGAVKLGIETYLVANIGNDKAGDEIVKFFCEKGIKLNAVQRSAEPTRDVLTTMTHDGIPNFGGFTRCRGCYSDAFLDKDQLNSDLLRHASVMYTGTLGLAYPKSREALNYAVNIIKEKNNVCVLNEGYDCIISKVFVDINWRPAFFDEPDKAKDMILKYLQKVDYVKATTEEAAWLLDVDEKEVLENPKIIFDKVPCLNLVMITAGSTGAAYAYHNRRTEEKFCNFIPSFKVKVADTAGAGDSFNAGFFGYLLKTHKINEFSQLSKDVWDKALTFAVASSALTCMGQGAIDAQPTYEEVHEFLKQHDRVLA